MACEWYAVIPESGESAMPEGLLPVLILIAAVLVYTIAKVFQYMRRSKEQWKEVDKSKLREWEDDDDWPDRD